MIRRRARTRPRLLRGRRGLAAVEMVVVLPVFCLICLATIDFARVFYAWAVLADCARNGAMYASDSSYATSTTYTSIQQAALGDATDLTPTPTVVTANGTDSSGVAYVEVTVNYTFKTICNYPGIPTSTALSRKIRMAVTPP